ncbi:hypothetical protein [Mucilaginibacter gracilis]|nr:hypothetical protein [Mucilaginibacter gracilis]
MVIPDTQAHLDGHSIITYTYSIFLDIDAGNPMVSRSKESTLHLEDIKDPNYYGYITFERPDSIFGYTPDGEQQLTRNEVEEVIEHLSDIRDNPALWNGFGYN